MFNIALKGALLSGSMIAAIGSQNAFLLKSGLKNNNVMLIATICFLGDVVLMGAGIFGLGAFISSSSLFTNVISGLGAMFLFWYGLGAMRSAIRGQSSVDLTDTKLKTTTSGAVLGTLAITFLNPHVYLDTVVIIGGIASTLESSEKIWFMSGSLLASFLWFYGLGFTSKKLVPFFSKAIVWRCLDSFIALIMFYIGTGLILTISLK